MVRLFPLLVAALLMTTGLLAADVPDFVPGSWTLVILPDTQCYQGSLAGIFTSQTQWIRNNAQTLNIKYVLQEGDITNNNYVSQWQTAKTAMSLLDGVVPYALVPGNHDCLDGSGKMTNRVSLFSTYFLSQAQGMPTFGGTYEPNNLNNSYHLFSAGGKDWIVIALEWAPRDAVLTWANGLLTAHSNRSAMIVTHAYLYSDSTRYHWATKGTSQNWNPHAYNTNGMMTGGVNDGEQIWQKLVKLHENVKFVFNGHVLNDGVGRLTSQGDHGNLVHQILANYQAPIQSEGGNGYLRLLEFRPDGKTVMVKTYSPYLNSYLTDDQQQFALSSTIPATPTNPGTANLTPTSIRFTWQDNSSNETGFKVYYDPGAGTPTTLRATTAANATYYDAVGLSSNTPYSFQVLATNDDEDGLKSTRLTAFTLSGPPSVGDNVICNKNINQPYPVGTSFIFSNPAGFGLNGPYKVSWFRYVWDTSPTHTWSGSEPTYWTSGSATLSQTPTTAGDYYLHLQANNAMPGLPNPTTLDYGPFRVDGTPPATSTAPAGGVYNKAVSVSLTADEPGVIYYTTDGSEPASSSSVYSSPIPINSDTTLRFYAVDTAGNAESPKKTQTYWILANSGSIAAVKNMTADSAVRLGSKNLHRKSGSFGYIEEPDRASGIRIEGNIAVDEGSVVSLVGRLQKPAGSECYVLLDAITSSGPAEIHPLGMNYTALSSQLSTGLCVRTWGIVKAGSVTSDSFILSDGSMNAGVKVITDGAPGVIGGQFVIVTGAIGFDGAVVIYATRVEGI